MEGSVEERLVAVKKSIGNLLSEKEAKKCQQGKGKNSSLGILSGRN